MRKRERGQAFILVLILLAIGALLTVPTLRLTGTALRNVPLVTGREKAIYAVDAGQEYVLWKLLHDDYGSYFDLEHDTGYLSLDVCGIPVDIVIVMRAVEGQGGMTLAGDDVIQPTKTVSHQYLPDNVPGKDWETYTYTITLEQLSDNISQGLDAIYDIPPIQITEYIGPTEISLDGGETWLTVPDPYDDELGSKGYIKWPADYEWETGTGAFSSDNGSDHYFHGIKDFEPRQMKMLRFNMRGRLDNDTVNCNWVILKPWNTVSGPQAAINVGNPADPGVCADADVIQISKVSDPDLIQPGVETDITYTITLTNDYTQTRHVESLIDYLPPGFDYIGPTSGDVTEEPDVTLENVNGVMRYKLLWTTPQFDGLDLPIASGEVLTITFLARATKDVSGSYYNEVFAILKATGISGAFEAAGVTPEEYRSNYSWNAGSVTVPTYDSSAGAGGVIVDANMALIFGGISITSYQWR